MTLDSLAGQLRNYENNMVTMGNVSKSSLTISNSKKKRKPKKIVILKLKMI